MYLLGIDIGSSSVKISLIKGETGGLVASSFYPKQEMKITAHKALGKPVKYNQEYSHWYTASGDYGLVDGLTGSLNFRDGHWQGFDSVDVDVIVDLAAKQKVASVSANFYQYNNAWIFFPTNVEVFLSKDFE